MKELTPEEIQREIERLDYYINSNIERDNKERAKILRDEKFRLLGNQ